VVGDTWFGHRDARHMERQEAKGAGGGFRARARGPQAPGWRRQVAESERLSHLCCDGALPVSIPRRAAVSGDREWGCVV